MIKQSHYFPIFIGLMLSISAHASSLKELIANDQLTVTVKIEQQQSYIVGAPLTVAVEVATDRWFAKGTQIKHFEMNDVVRPTNNQTTSNGTQRIKGETWSTQTTYITLYPTRAGDYSLPEIPLFISVNSEEHDVIAGEISTQTQHFNVDLPSELAGIASYVISPDFSLVIDGDFVVNHDYSVGDAITQTITMTAADTPAMMLPPAPSATIEGVSIYQKPGKLFDASNRGSLIGRRIDTTTYIFEKPGSYQIAEQTINWWDSSTNQLKQIIIPKRTWTVAGGSSASIANEKTGLNFNWVSLLISGLIILLSLGLYGFYRHKNRLFTLYAKFTKLERRRIVTGYFNAIKQHNYPRASQYVYQYSLAKGVNQQQIKRLELMIRLNQIAFGPTKNTINKSAFTISDAKQLLSQIKQNAIAQKTISSEQERIQLNQ